MSNVVPIKPRVTKAAIESGHQALTWWLKKGNSLQRKGKDDSFIREVNGAAKLVKIKVSSEGKDEHIYRWKDLSRMCIIFLPNGRINGIRMINPPHTGPINQKPEAAAQSQPDL